MGAIAGATWRPGALGLHRWRHLKAGGAWAPPLALPESRGRLGPTAGAPRTAGSLGPHRWRSRNAGRAWPLTCRRVHLQDGAPAGRCTCRTVHLQDGAPAGGCTRRKVHLQDGAPAGRCTCRRVHPQAGAPAGWCTRLRCTFRDFYLRRSRPLVGGTRGRWPGRGRWSAVHVHVQQAGLGAPGSCKNPPGWRVHVT